MAVNITLLSAAAPYIIDAANRILSIINKNKQEKTLEDRVLSFDEKLALYEKRQEELLTINEEQSKVIKDLAEQNQKLILAVRNTRIAAILAVILSISSLAVAIFFR
jgi:hypothetical protein